MTRSEILERLNALDDELATAKAIHNRLEQDAQLEHISDLIKDWRDELEEGTK